jgi:hypothetical protein
LPLVGTGEKNALCISSISPGPWRTKLRTLPALELRRLELLFNEPVLRREAFFFKVAPLDGIRVSPWDMTELDRCIGPSMIELPRWLASHSSLKRPLGATDCDSGDVSTGWPGADPDPKSVAALAGMGFDLEVPLAPYPRSRWCSEGGGMVEFALRDAIMKSS